ncbi:MAG: ATP-binding protein [Actinobacteria bacterium]|nr:ATP-binding protein [Actinomycetota bacterium]
MTTTATRLEFSLPAVPASVRKARVSVAETVTELGASERVVDDVRLCVSEAVSNVVRHAYGNGWGDVDVVVEREEGALNVVVRDFGQGIGPKSSRRKTNGGYGLKIIEKVAERLHITSARADGTEVRMVFLLAGGTPGGAPPS